MTKSRPICIPDVQYFSGKRLTQSRRNPSRQVPTRRQFRNLLKYLTYREGSLRRAALRAGALYRDIVGMPDAIPASESPDERWTDCGMGWTYREIMDRAVALGDETVLARTWVVSPDPALLAHVPEAERVALVARLTEEVMEDFHAAQGWPVVEYSYVVHTRETEQGHPHVHAHVVSAGTYLDPLDGMRVGASRRNFGERRYFVGKEQLGVLRDLSQQAFGRELSAALGEERAQELLAERGIEDEESQPELMLDDPFAA
jgi:hypothetical protein